MQSLARCSRALTARTCWARLPQALNCAAGGGKAAIFMDRAASDPCSLLTGALVVPPGVPLPPGYKCPSTAKYLPAVGLTRSQGLAIKALLDAKKAVTATVKLLSPEDNAKVGGRLGASCCRTGTAMAEALSRADASAAATARGPLHCHASLSSKASSF
jgi:hypothetical protein